MPATANIPQLILMALDDQELAAILTLAFNSEVFSNDPALQFAIGGRTVDFIIPGASTQAVFPNIATPS